MNYLNNFSFIVSCHNANLPVLEIFEKYAHDYFNLDKKIKKYLICEDYFKSDSYFDVILKNKAGKKWSEQLIDSLKLINSKYVIYCLEDYIFYKNVDIKIFNHYLNWVYLNDANYLRLMPKPKGFKKIDDNIYELGPYSLYKNSLFFTVWNRELLIKLLRMYDNPWKFEVLGTLFVRQMEKFYTVNKKFIFIHHIVAKGCWIKRNIKKIKIDKKLIDKKPMMNSFVEFKWHIKRKLLSLLELIPDNYLKFTIYYLFKAKK